MPLQNRVDPFGAICAVPNRGLMMGNRGGRIHDPATKTLLKRRHASRRWIICECSYKDWHREVMGEGYTELFFLDEVTALAAGHRPCAFCRREAFNDFRQCCGASAESVDALDRQLHAQRVGSKPLYTDLFAASAPDGIVVAVGNDAYAKKGDCAFCWSFEGYTNKGSWIDIANVNPPVLTPAVSITALQKGYAPVWHPSAAI